MAGRGLAVSLTALHRGIAGAESADADGVLRVDVEARPDQRPAGTLTHELEREYRALVDEILELRGDDGRIRAHAAGLTEVIVLERNQHDLDDVPSEVRERMRFHIVASVDQVLAVALEPLEVAKAA